MTSPIKTAVGMHICGRVHHRHKAVDFVERHSTVSHVPAALHDSKAIRHKGAVGVARVCGGVGAGTVIVGKRCRLVDVDIAQQVDR